MRIIVLISTLLLLFSCKQSTKATDTSSPAVQEVLPIKESVFLTMERTPCYGTCPSYKITIFNTGNVIYEGFSFATKEGKYTKKLTQQQLLEIQSQINIVGIFNFKDKYDSPITDVPSTILYIIYNGKKKKILDRDGAPKELKRFEKFIDILIIDNKLKKQ